MTVNSKPATLLIQRLDKLQQEICSELRNLKADLQRVCNRLEIHLTNQQAELDQLLAKPKTKHLLWQKLWQELDWLFCWAIGTGIGLIIARVVLKC